MRAESSVKRPLRTVLLLTAVAAGIGTLSALSLAAAHRLTEPLSPVEHSSVRIPDSATLAPGTPPVIPVPNTGAFELDSDIDGRLAAAHADSVQPIGSVAKTMTALVVLGARPLNGDEPGPVVTMTQADVERYRQAVAEQGSTAPVALGERLTERQLLLALLLPSANNIAETLAAWVAGDRASFIAMLNSRAAVLGMSHTHFDDPSGYSGLTVASASDLVVLARAVLSDPEMAALVGTATATLPDGTVIRNLDILLRTTPGWLGIKTGWTPQAGGCLLFAARQFLEGASAPVTLYGAVLGQPPLATADAAHPELGGAFASTRSAVAAAFLGYSAVDPSRLTMSISGALTTPWGSSTSLAAATAASHTLAVRLGTVLQLRLALRDVVAPVGARTVVGYVSGQIRGATLESWPVVVRQALPEPNPWWRLLHG